VWTKPYASTSDYQRIQQGIKAAGLPPGIVLTGEPEEWMCTLSITTFDPKTNSYEDKDPENMVKYLDKLQQ